MPDPVTPPPASPARPTCATCRWWDADEHTHKEAAEGFDRYASCVIRSTPGTFPSLHAKNWCGEHAPIEAPRG